MDTGERLPPPQPPSLKDVKGALSELPQHRYPGIQNFIAHSLISSVDSSSKIKANDPEQADRPVANISSPQAGNIEISVRPPDSKPEGDRLLVGIQPDGHHSVYLFPEGVTHDDKFGGGVLSLAMAESSEDKRAFLERTIAVAENCESLGVELTPKASMLLKDPGNPEVRKTIQESIEKPLEIDLSIPPSATEDTPPLLTEEPEEPLTDEDRNNKIKDLQDEVDKLRDTRVEALGNPVFKEHDAYIVAKNQRLCSKIEDLEFAIHALKNRFNPDNYYKVGASSPTMVHHNFGQHPDDVILPAYHINSIGGKPERRIDYENPFKVTDIVLWRRRGLDEKI